LDARHVLASSAIPALFPAVEVVSPAPAAGWYFDGGVRLNTPIKPALALGARRVLVVATSAADPPLAGPVRPGRPPGIAGGAAELFYAMLADRMVEDLRALSSRNEPDVAGDRIPWLFGGPGRDDAGLLGRLVGDVLTGSAGGARPRRSPLTRLTRRAVGRLLTADPNRAELVSYLFFDPEFIDAAIGLGRRDAEQSLGPGGVPVWNGVG
jgi:NTE family protein